MKLTAQIVSWIALVALVVPALLYLGGRVSLERVHSVMLIATIAWFIAAPIAMMRSASAPESSPASTNE